MTVLDAGCGAGRMAIELAQRSQVCFMHYIMACIDVIPTVLARHVPWVADGDAGMGSRGTSLLEYVHHHCLHSCSRLYAGRVQYDTLE
jgi:SAM-dependent methyltransferase